MAYRISINGFSSMPKAKKIPMDQKRSNFIVTEIDNFLCSLQIYLDNMTIWQMDVDDDDDDNDVH